MSFSAKRVYDSYHNWREPISDLETTKRLITGNCNKDFLPDILSEHLQKVFVEMKFSRILDFGGGLGRNLPLLKKYSQKVDYLDLAVYKGFVDSCAYDNKVYIEDVKEFHSKSSIKNYDLIYASVVLQHFVDRDLVESAVDFFHKSARYVFLVQNCRVPMHKSFESLFDLLATDRYKGSFGLDHHYSLFIRKQAH